MQPEFMRHLGADGYAMPDQTEPADTIFDAVLSAASRNGQAKFLVIGRRREILSFDKLAEDSDTFGRLLDHRGARPGDRVAIWMTNHVEWPIAAFGTARIGGVVVAVSSRLTGPEAAHVLALSGARFLVIEDWFLDKIEALPILAVALAELRARGLPVPQIVLCRRVGCGATVPPPPEAIDWHPAMSHAANLPALPPAADLVATRHPDHPELAGVAAILSTSGTTGSPKGVMLTHAGLLRLARAVAERQALVPGERFYSIAPFFHCSGFMHGLLTCLVSGATFFASNAYSSDEVWDVITSEGVTAYHGFIEPLLDISTSFDRDLTRLSRFSRAWYSAPAAMMARIENRLGVRQCEVYGLTETGGNISICTSDDPIEMRHDSDGRPHAGLEVRIVDPITGNDLPERTPGEIRVRGWNVMRGYFRDPEATARAIDPDGWLATGDQGIALPGGYIKFVSRLKDVIRVGGENLSPIEVEEVLIDHPAVFEAAVVAAPDARLGEVPIAFLRLRPGTAVTPDELATHCRARLAKFKLPRRFIIVEDFPRTGATSRIQKAQLRAMLGELMGDTPLYPTDGSST